MSTKAVLEAQVGKQIHPLQKKGPNHRVESK